MPRSKRRETYDKVPLPNKTLLLLHMAVVGKVNRDQPNLEATLASEVGYSVSQVYNDIESLLEGKLIREKTEDDGSHSYVVTRKGYNSIRSMFASPLFYGAEIALISILLVCLGVGSLYGMIGRLALAVVLVAVAAVNGIFGILMMWTPIRLSKMRKRSHDEK